MTRTNEFGQAIGEKLPVGWKEPTIPDKKPINPPTGKEINKGIFL